MANEPITASDVSIQTRIINLFKNLWQEMGLSCLLIFHDLSIIRYACQAGPMLAWLLHDSVGRHIADGVLTKVWTMLSITGQLPKDKVRAGLVQTALDVLLDGMCGRSAAGTGMPVRQAASCHGTAHFTDTPRPDG